MSETESGPETDPEMDPETDPETDVEMGPGTGLEVDGVERAAETGATGLEDVDDALGRLAELDDLPVDQHPEVFEQVHGRLRQALRGDSSAG